MHGIRWRASRAGRSSTDGYWNGGTLATAGNLVFQGTAAGDFFAYNASNGQKLWSAWVGTGIMAPPITYEIAGKQYVSVMAGWGGAFARRARTFGRLMTFAIDGKAALPARPAPRRVTAIASTAKPDEIAAGAKLYATYCVRCHGSNTMLPDLRTSTPAVYAGLEKILLDAALADRGMPGFAVAESFDVRSVAAIRAYLLEERRKLAEAR